MVMLTLALLEEPDVNTIDRLENCTKNTWDGLDGWKELGQIFY